MVENWPKNKTEVVRLFFSQHQLPTFWLAFGYIVVHTGLVWPPSRQSNSTMGIVKTSTLLQPIFVIPIYPFHFLAPVLAPGQGPVEHMGTQRRLSVPKVIFLQAAEFSG